MIRLLIGLPVLILLVAGGVLFYAYGEIDPCRVLAVERGRRADAETGIHLHKLVEPWMRMATSQMTTGECTRELITSWRERLDERAEADVDRTQSGDN